MLSVFTGEAVYMLAKSKLLDTGMLNLTHRTCEQGNQFMRSDQNFAPMFDPLYS
jgi:hypothetical protein